jgi:hypothetical protein
MVLIELLSGSSSKTQILFTGSRQDQLVIDLINPFECLIYPQWRLVASPPMGIP